MTNTGTSVAVPNLAGLAKGLQRAKAQMPSFGGKAFIKFDKDGTWYFGKNGDICNEDRAVLNIHTLAAGYVCWTDYDKETLKTKRKNEKLGEEMVLSSQGAVDPADLPDTGWEWKQQQAVDGRFLDGDRAQFEYKTSSLGGLEAMDTIIDAVMQRIHDGETVYLYPVVQLSGTTYPHDTWGTVHKPSLDIVAWADINGDVEGEKKAEGKKVTKDPEPEVEPVKETAAPATRRRRSDPVAEEQAEPADEGGAETEDEDGEADGPPVRRRRRR